MIRHRHLIGLAMAFGLALASPAHAEWLRAETAHFIIYGDTSERDIRNYARKVETFDALLRTYYPIVVDHEIPKLEIYMANGQRDMNRAEPGISTSVGGFYAPNARRIHAVANMASPMADDVIFHEYTHHFMFQMASNAYPAWFVEGFAEYYATVELRGDTVRLGGFSPGRMNSLTQAANTWPPMEDVLNWRISPTGRYRGAHYYALSWAMTHYMLSTPERTRQLGLYLAAVAGGRDPVEALNGTIDRTPAQLQNDVRRYLNGAITILTPQISLPAPDVAVTPLSPELARVAWLDLRLDRADPTRREIEIEKRADETDAAFARRSEEARAEFAKERAALIADAQAAATADPTSPVGLLIKARGERLAGRPEDAAETLKPLVADPSTDARILRTYAENLLDVAQDAEDPLPFYRDARTALGRALDQDSLDFQTYLTLDRMRQRIAGYPNANDVSTLEVAVALAPQSFDARLRYARALIATGDPADAVVILTPVANSPHGGTSRGSARALLAEARTQAGLAPATSGGPAPDEQAPEGAPPVDEAPADASAVDDATSPA